MKEFDTTVLGGLPVTIAWDSDSWWFTAINGRDVKVCNWLDRRIDDTPGERERIEREVIDARENFYYEWD